MLVQWTVVLLVLLVVLRKPKQGLVAMGRNSMAAGCTRETPAKALKSL